MKYIQIFAQTIFLFIMPLIGNAETTCLDKVKTLELKRNHAVSIGGMWGYFEKNFSLKKNPAEAIPHRNSLKEYFQKMKNLTIDVDHLLSNQPYLSQALEETSHFLYWDDLSEGDVG